MFRPSGKSSFLEEGITFGEMVLFGGPVHVSSWENHRKNLWKKHVSMDWFKGTFTGLSPIFNGKIYGFRVRFFLKPIHWTSNGVFWMGISSKTEGVKIGISIVNGGVIGTCIQWKFHCIPLLDDVPSYEPPANQTSMASSGCSQRHTMDVYRWGSGAQTLA